MELAERIRNLLEAKVDESVRLVLLFGSQASASAGPLSDIDVGVYLDSSVYTRGDHRIALKLGAILEIGLGTEMVDVVVLNDASPALRFNIIRACVPVLVRDEGEYEDFVVKSLSEYYDYQPFLDRQYETAKTSLEAGASR